MICCDYLNGWFVSGTVGGRRQEAENVGAGQECDGRPSSSSSSSLSYTTCEVLGAFCGCSSVDCVCLCDVNQLDISDTTGFLWRGEG